MKGQIWVITWPLGISLRVGSPLTLVNLLKGGSSYEDICGVQCTHLSHLCCCRIACFRVDLHVIGKLISVVLQVRQTWCCVSQCYGALEWEDELGFFCRFSACGLWEHFMFFLCAPGCFLLRALLAASHTDHSPSPSSLLCFQWGDTREKCFAS